MPDDELPWFPRAAARTGLTQREFRERQRERRIHEHIEQHRRRGAQTRPRDRGLTREDIVDAAVEVADAEGVDAVSMRRIARELRAGAMSLYWHVESKDELLDLMLERVEGEMLFPEPSGDWRADLRTAAFNARAVLMRHQWAMDLLGVRPPTGPNNARNGDRLFGILLNLGLEPVAAVRLAITFLTFVLGAIQQQVREIRGEREMAEATADLTEEELDAFREDLFKRIHDSGDYPSIARLFEEDIDPDDPATRDERFEFGIEVMLDGIAARLPR